MTGDFTFIHYSYDHDLQPSLTLLAHGSDSFAHFCPRGQSLTLQFTTTTRYCTGWHDLASSQSFPCPTAASVQKEYSQCVQCQRKTGFNPAFYNANSVSPQQQERNAQPHFLYLAHFAPGVVKVGISWSKRGIRRLLDQGARSYLVLKEYPNAHIARQYEAKIASLPGIAESLQSKAKYALLARPYNQSAGAQELCAVRDRIVNELAMQPDGNHPQHTDHHYIADNTFTARDLITIDENCISGYCLGLIGSALITEQDNTPYMLSLSRLTGYQVSISDKERQNQHMPKQTSLF